VTGRRYNQIWLSRPMAGRGGNLRQFYIAPNFKLQYNPVLWKKQFLPRVAAKSHLSSVVLVDRF
jgi:hypothetical protein